jgi:hypothetical protein
MHPLDNPYSKESQLKNAPGNRKKQSNQEKGATAEKKAITEICSQLSRKPGKQDRQNNQRRKGGGLGISDISIKDLEGWHPESKAGNTYQFPAFWKQLREECPKNKRPALIFTTNEGEQYLQIRLKDLANLAQDVILGRGFEII